MDAMNERLGISREKMVINLDRYGLPLLRPSVALNEAVRGGQVKHGDKVMICALVAAFHGRLASLNGTGQRLKLN